MADNITRITSIKVQVDTSGLDKFSRSQEELNRTLSKSQREMGLTYNSQNLLVNSQGKCVEGLSKTQIQLGYYIDSLGRTRTSQDGFTDGLNKAQQQMGMYRDEAGNLYARNGELLKSFDDLSKSADKTASAISNTFDANNQIRGAAGQLASSMGALKSSLPILGEFTDGFAQLSNFFVGGAGLIEGVRQASIVLRTLLTTNTGIVAMKTVEAAAVGKATAEYEKQNDALQKTANVLDRIKNSSEEQSNLLRVMVKVANARYIKELTDELHSFESAIKKVQARLETVTEQEAIDYLEAKEDELIEGFKEATKRVEDFKDVMKFATEETDNPIDEKIEIAKEKLDEFQDKIETVASAANNEIRTATDSFDSLNFKIESAAAFDGLNIKLETTAEDFANASRQGARFGDEIQYAVKQVNGAIDGLQTTISSAEISTNNLFQSDIDKLEDLEAEINGLSFDANRLGKASRKNKSWDISGNIPDYNANPSVRARPVVPNTIGIDDAFSSTEISKSVDSVKDLIDSLTSGDIFGATKNIEELKDNFSGLGKVFQKLPPWIKPVSIGLGGIGAVAGIVGLAIWKMNKDLEKAVNDAIPGLEEFKNKLEEDKKEAIALGLAFETTGDQIEYGIKKGEDSAQALIDKMKNSAKTAEELAANSKGFWNGLWKLLTTDTMTGQAGQKSLYEEFLTNDIQNELEEKTKYELGQKALGFIEANKKRNGKSPEAQQLDDIAVLLQNKIGLTDEQIKVLKDEQKYLKKQVEEQRKQKHDQNVQEFGMSGYLKSVGYGELSVESYNKTIKEWQRLVKENIISQAEYNEAQKAYKDAVNEDHRAKVKEAVATVSSIIHRNDVDNEYFKAMEELNSSLVIQAYSAENYTAMVDKVKDAYKEHLDQELGLVNDEYAEYRKTLRELDKAYKDAILSEQEYTYYLQKATENERKKLMEDIGLDTTPNYYNGEENAFLDTLGDKSEFLKFASDKEEKIKKIYDAWEEGIISDLDATAALIGVQKEFETSFANGLGYDDLVKETTIEKTRLERAYEQVDQFTKAMQLGLIDNVKGQDAINRLQGIIADEEDKLIEAQEEQIRATLEAARKQEEDADKLDLAYLDLLQRLNQQDIDNMAMRMTTSTRSMTAGSQDVYRTGLNQQQAYYNTVKGNLSRIIQELVEMKQNEMAQKQLEYDTYEVYGY